MKMIKPIVAFLFVFALVFSVHAQDAQECAEGEWYCGVCESCIPNDEAASHAEGHEGEAGDCGEGYWHCAECGECVPDGDEQSHHVDVHGGTYADFVCMYQFPDGGECGETFDTEEALHAHMHCGTCGVAFDSGEDMDQHHQAAHAADHEPATGGDPPPEGGGEMGPPPFEEVDADGDGLISREEAEEAFGAEHEDWEEKFDHKDTNDDGSVDPAEYHARHDEDCAPDNAYDANCGAICAGMDDYYIDTDDDCEADDGPYATWHEPACKCPEEGGN